MSKARKFFNKVALDDRHDNVEMTLLLKCRKTE